MKIKINDSNKALIDDALAQVNGNAKTHTFSSKDIFRFASDLENELHELGIPKKKRKNATFAATSGEELPKCYGYKRVVTGIEMQRDTVGWNLVKIIRDKTGYWPGRETLKLTEEQDDIAVRNFRCWKVVVGCSS